MSSEMVSLQGLASWQMSRAWHSFWQPDSEKARLIGWLTFFFAFAMAALALLMSVVAAVMPSRSLLAAAALSAVVAPASAALPMST